VKDNNALKDNDALKDIGFQVFAGGLHLEGYRAFAEIGLHLER